MHISTSFKPTCQGYSKLFFQRLRIHSSPNSPEGILSFHLHLLGSFFYFFLFFYRSTCFGSAWSFGSKDFLSQILSIAFFSFLNSSERASIFPFNVECLLSIPTFDICSSFCCVYLHMYGFCAN